MWRATSDIVTSPFSKTPYQKRSGKTRLDR